MPPRAKRYAVDPSLTAPVQQQQAWQQAGPPQGPTFSPAGAAFGPGPVNPTFQQQQQQPQQQAYGDQQHHQQYNAQAPQAPAGEYAPVGQAPRRQDYSYAGTVPQQYQQQPQQPQQQQQPYNYPPSNHIAPPPHSAGPQLTGPRVRIDPSQMPDPIEAQELDQNLYDDEDFHSCDTKGLIPLAITDYRGVDQGNSLPRHLRATLPTIPSTHQLLDTTALPFGVVVQPFAPLRYDENPIPLVTNWVAGESAFDAPRAPSGEDEIGPPRCDKCRAYINPWVRFTDGGRRWACNLCGGETHTPASYFANLAPSGQRLDHHDRPELQFGTVDFAVPREYWAPQPKGDMVLEAEDESAATIAAAGDALATTGADLLGALQSSLGQTPVRGSTPQPGHREKLKEEQRRQRRPQPLGRVFVIDVSANSSQRFIVREVCEAIRRALYGEKKENGEEDEEVIGKGERVAFITVGQTVGFWNLAPALSQPQLLVVSDLDDMYCPLIGGFLVDPTTSKSQVDALLTLIPNMYEPRPDGTACAMGAALKGALAGLRAIGGQVNYFLSALPVLGPGKLKPRDDPAVMGTDKEKTLYQPGDSFWRVIADEYAECGVGVNTFVFPDKVIDLASIGAPSMTTGGEIIFHPRFDPVRDRDALQEEVKRVVVRETAYNAMVRVRCSNGLRVNEHTGCFYQRTMTDLEFGTIDESKAFTAQFKHDGHRLNDREMSYVQVAILYTSCNGERRVRCLNLCMPVSSLIGNVFRFADFDATVTTFYKDAVAQLPYKNLREIRKNAIERANRVLYMYRKHCAPAVQSGQLILPEGFKLLPLYTLCMVKSKPIKGGNVIADVRVHYKQMAKSMSAGAIMNILYPKMLAVHDLAETYGFPGPNGRLRLPRNMRLSYNYMVPEGAYLMSDGEVSYIWFGHSVSPRILDDLYGVENLDELDTRITRLPKLPTTLSTQVRNILTHFERLAGRALPLMVIRQDRDGLELDFANHLIEDANNDALSYTDYLMTAHKAITNDISGKSDGWKAPWS